MDEVTKELVEASTIALHEITAIIGCLHSEITRNEMQANADRLRAAIARASHPIEGNDCHE